MNKVLSIVTWAVIILVVLMFVSVIFKQEPPKVDNFVPVATEIRQPNIPLPVYYNSGKE
jgi:hypothetical protein